MRRSNSLPHIGFDCAHPRLSRRPKLSVAKQYKGRFSLTKVKPRKASRGDEGYHPQRSRNSSGRGRNGRLLRLDSATIFYEECASYGSLWIERETNEEATRGHPQSVATSSVIPRDLTSRALDRNEFHRRLQALVSSNASTKLNRFSEQSTLESVRKHSRQVYLIGRRNERHKLGDVLWLQLQALIAGRPMRTLKDQLQSTRDQDAYLLERRELQKCILDEIRSFSFETSSPVTVDNSGSPLTETASKDTMKAKLKRVRGLLDSYEEFVALFPDTASMMKMVEIDRTLRDRVSLLYMWYNTTIDLYARIREVGVILGMNKDESSARRYSTLSPNVSVAGALSPSAISWPTLDSPQEDSVRELFSRSTSNTTPGLNPHSPQSAGVRSSTSSDLPALLGQSNSLYTDFVSKSLRLKGMRRVLERLESVCKLTVKKAVALLRMPPRSYAEAAGALKPHPVNRWMPLTADNFLCEMVKELDDLKPRERSGEGSRHSVHHVEFKAMGLPSFGDLLHFLVRVPLDLVHEWLKMRGSAQLTSDLLTIQTVMEDYRDCLGAAIAVKHKYITLVQLADLDNGLLLDSLATFENHLGVVFKNYLKSVRDWAQLEVSLENESSEWSERVVQTLIKEWNIAKRFAINVISGESEVALRFCDIGSDLLKKMVNDFLSEKENNLEEFRTEFDSPPSSLSVEAEELSSPRKHSSQIFVACRRFKSLVGQLRDRALRAVSFARSVLTDVEICALYNIRSSDVRALRYQLFITSHSLVIVPNMEDRYVIFCDRRAADNHDFVRILLNITCSRNEHELPSAMLDCHGYLLIFPLGALGDFSYDNWRGNKICVSLDADTEMSLRYLQISTDACLVALNGTSLSQMRRFLAQTLTAGNECLLEIIEEQSSCHEVVLDRIETLKEGAIETCRILWTGLASRLADEVLDGRPLSSLDQNEMESMRATLLQAYNLAFEYHRELYRLLPRSSRKAFAEETVLWVKQWYAFVKNVVLRGDGTVPLWALQSFQFLILAADPQLTSLLSNNEYQTLVSTIDSCVEHIIGGGSQDSGVVSGDFFDRDHEQLDNSMRRRTSSVGHVQVSLDASSRARRIQALVQEIDRLRDSRLEKENKIGHVRSEGIRNLPLNSYFDPKKRAPFEWQRLEKIIGSGKFGTVYVVMNLTDHCLMAMKQIRIDCNHKALHALVDEVENLRSLDHPNLVKYYAVEVHREELLIFMEYCSEGTLEGVCREGLLDMRCVRRYTHFLLKAVAFIHMKMVIHRDIKPANIFLGKKDVLKLGDFGSSVRLRGGSTAFGEVVEWAGTPAYMAPEVQTLGGKVDVGAGREELLGYGRAADIWSVGCVVLEMCTGKPPWHECEQIYQIVFRVGSGLSPTIPQHIQANEECYSFLMSCFQSDPFKRATAEQLMQHTFANINVAGESVDPRLGNFY